MSKYTNKDQTGGRSAAEVAATIAAGQPAMADKVVLWDFDATIAPFGHMFSFPEPFTGAADFAKMLKANNYNIGIFTSRLSPLWLASVDQTAEQHTEYITEYCSRYDIPFDFITAEKRPAQVMIDDKALRFEGSYIDMVYEFVVRGWV